MPGYGPTDHKCVDQSFPNSVHLPVSLAANCRLIMRPIVGCLRRVIYRIRMPRSRDHSVKRVEQCSEKEAARTAGRVGNERARFRTHAFNHRTDESTGREILTSARFGILSVLLKIKWTPLSRPCRPGGIALQGPGSCFGTWQKSDQACPSWSRVRGAGRRNGRRVPRISSSSSFAS